MATGVGLRIADDECVAAIVTGDDATLPVHYIVRESTLHMSDDGDAVLGDEQPDDHSHSISGFVAKVGDPAGIPVDDGEAYRAEDLWATAAFCLINLAADHLNGPAEFYATHPTGWQDEQIRAVRDALDYLGLKSVVLVSERDLSVETDTGKALAYQAARTALAAVLATPAGLTPPDPTVTENSAEVTEVLPAIKVPEPPAQAYSVAIPVPLAETTAEPAVAPSDEPAHAPPRNRGPILIAIAAAVVGLLLGGLGVAAVLRTDDTGTGTPRGDVLTEPDATAGAVPPPVPSESETPTAAAPPPPEEAPPASTEAPPPATEAPTTTPEPSPTPSSTRPTPTSPTRTPPYIYRPPQLPTLEIPPPPIFQDPWLRDSN
ncbi:hypothetical protein [Nocardia sp. NPDC050406]|uniref:hypothetical protein n=1 Tax=Nocardia sp. NPDC050406 TaxID=3364318 RepID=UPI0037969A6A